MKHLLFQTRDDWAPLVSRLFLAVVFFPHGAQKALGWFGGGGLEGTLGFFTTQMGVPLVVALMIVAAEFLGSIGLIFGFLTRITGIGLTLVMTGAIFIVHLPNGFFMNWFGQKQGEGFEFHLLAIAVALSLLITGGGKWSLDGLIDKKLREKEAS